MEKVGGMNNGMSLFFVKWCESERVCESDWDEVKKVGLEEEEEEEETKVNDIQRNGSLYGLRIQGG